MEISMRRLLIGCGTLLLLGVASIADAQQAINPIASLVGYWDLPGTTIRLKIHPDGTVDHSALGEGTIRFDETSYYRLVFRQRHLTCQYDVRKYSENELTFTVSLQPSDGLCELGALRRSPGSPVPEPKGKSSEAPAAAAVAAAAEKKETRQPGSAFKDCEDCPEMMALATGRFTMGSPISEAGRFDIEGPQRTVEVTSSFAVGRYAVTRDQYDAFVKATGRLYNDGCRVEAGNEWSFRADLSLRKVNFEQDGRHPVVCVNWEDAGAYAKWLIDKDGQVLPAASLKRSANMPHMQGAPRPTGGEIRYSPELANYYKDSAQPAAINKMQVASTPISKKCRDPADVPPCLDGGHGPRPSVPAQPLGSIPGPRQRCRMGRGLLE